MTPSRGESGQTLIELVVAMTIGIVVLFGVLNSFDVFAATQKKTDDAAAAQDAARAATRSIVATLRQARVPANLNMTTPVPVQPSRSDLVFAAYVSSATNPAPGSTAGWVRYCTQTTATSVSLLVGVRAGDAYAAPGACALGDTTNSWSYGTLVSKTLQDPGRLFDYASSNCPGGTAAQCPPPAAAIQSVGIRVAVGRYAGATTALNSVVRDAVSFRNRSTAGP